MPVWLQLIATVRPKHACRVCTDGVTQAPAPTALIEGGLPTEGAIQKQTESFKALKLTPAQT